MSTRHARIEIRPANETGIRTVITEDGQPLEVTVPPSQRMHYLCLVAANGSVLATSETYDNRTNARRAVRSWLDAFCSVMQLENGWGDLAFKRTGSYVSVVEYDIDGNQVRP